MTKKDFEIIAAALKSAKPDTYMSAEGQGAWYRVSVAVREAVGATNPRFNANVFDLAAGIAGQ